MKASVLTAYGSPAVLQYREVPDPQPGPGEVRLRVLAAGLNRLDHYLRNGDVRRDLALPHILGSDGVAIVEENGPGATRFSTGDRVTFLPGYPLEPAEATFTPLSAAPSYVIRGILEPGTYAEQIVVPERWILRDDTGLSPEEVATLPMPLVTGVRAVKVIGEVTAGARVLVHGGGSGTGAANIQIARALGARVATTIRTEEKADFVRGFGAELVINLASDDFVAASREWSAGGVDVVIDNLGGEILTRSLGALRPTGILVSMGMVMGMEATVPIFPFFFTQKQIRGTLMGDLADLEWGLAQVRAGQIRPMLDRVFPLQDAAAAHARLADGKAHGTIVLKP